MKKILPGLFAILLFASCKKEISSLPDTSQSGSNTFGAKINGDLWGPAKFGPFSGDILVTTKAGNRFTIDANNFASSPNETEMIIVLYDVTGPGVYQLNTNTSHPNGQSSYAYYVKRNMTPINEWITSSTYSGSVNITKLDSVNKILSGTFQFDAHSLSLYDSDVMHATEGRFDVKYQ
jgi:hypothetical protein